MAGFAPRERPQVPRQKKTMMKEHWRQGHVDASLRKELKDAYDRGDLHRLSVRFPTAEKGLVSGQTLESLWAPLRLPLGSGDVCLSLQLGFLPRKDADEEAWHLLLRVRELGRTTTSEDLDNFWAVRLVIEVASPDGSSMIARVHDHRTSFPDVYVVHMQRSFFDADSQIQALKSVGSASVTVCAEVFDAKGPPAGTRDRGDCC
jgi:hypothetical protein